MWDESGRDKLSACAIDPVRAPMGPSMHGQPDFGSIANLSRRGALRLGALTIGGVAVRDLLRADSGSAISDRKSIINIYLAGGPPHQDTFDLKPHAPKEIRGEFSPIATNVSGVEVCELMPELARRADRFAVVRSLTGMFDEHTPTQSDSGWSTNDLRSIGGRPGVGPVLSKLWGPAQKTPHGSAPTCIDLAGWTSAGFLGPVYAAFQPDGRGRENLQLNRVSRERFGERGRLLTEFDRIRRDLDSKGRMDALDSFSHRAAGLITSGNVAAALDFGKESDVVKRRYGLSANGENERFLLARRLVDAGVRHVAFSWGSWDTHQDNFQSMRRMLPALDRGLSALLDDLANSGQLEDTLIMMSGEFGRTPRVNGIAGRDHWPRAGFFFLAGGGLRMGQVIGSTNRLGEQPSTRPVHLQHVFSTVYRWLGVDMDTVTLVDPNGRPQYLLDQREAIAELISGVSSKS